MPVVKQRFFWRFVRGLAPPVLVFAALVAALAYALYSRVQFWPESDEENMREWLSESRVFRKTLPELVRDYLQEPTPAKKSEIESQLEAMGEPTKIHQGMSPLFAVVYRIEVIFDGDSGAPLPGIAWDSQIPYQPSQVRRVEERIHDRAVVRMDYVVHAYNKQQQVESQRQVYAAAVIGLTIAAALFAGLWVYFFLKRERERELQRLMAEHQVEHAEKLLLENELRRQEAERKQGEMERKLLEQRVATHEAEQRNLEMKSQLYASIGIMAGSYAHNIKNLLVRPNDLLRRCLEADGLHPDQEHMLHEVRHTLGTVTERLQEILKTIRRDPTRSEMARIDLNDIVREIEQGWQDMASQKWKLTLSTEASSEPLWIEGDRSHLMQAVENLVFNARDATFEMRTAIRDQARSDGKFSEEERRQALIAAAGWKGSIRLRTLLEDGAAILEVCDNGIGMTEEVRRRCVETHFSTKRDNAQYEGNTTGMGLGLSFVQTILEHHQARMEIASQPLQGATFRLRFPAAGQRSGAAGESGSPASSSMQSR